MTTRRNHRFTAALIASAAAMAVLMPYEMPPDRGIPPPDREERALPPAPPKLRDPRDRKRRKPLKAARKKKPVFWRMRRARLATAPEREGFDMRHDEYLHEDWDWSDDYPGRRR